MRRNEAVFNILSIDMLKEEIEAIKKGCGNKVSNGKGTCAYISTAGNLRLCNKCKRHLNMAEAVLETKENAEI